MSSTHTESTGDGHSVRIQHCEDPSGCDEYLGVNYPSSFCDKHQPAKVTS
jgi:hypothetical protein